MKITLLAAGAFLSALSAHATSLSLDFATSGGAQSGSGYSNVRTYTDNGVTITVTGWSVTGSNFTTFQSANVGQYSGYGLGVCDQKEGGTNCAAPDHQVDNATAYDFILVQFSKSIVLPSFTIQPYGTYDRDVTYYTGNAASGLNLTGVALSGLSALGLTNTHNDDSTVSSNARIVDLITGAVNTILFGARVGGDSNSDYFKIAGFDATVSSAPEPATYAIVGAALLVLSIVSRRPSRR